MRIENNGSAAASNELYTLSLDELHKELVLLNEQRPVWDDIGGTQHRKERQYLLTHAYVEKLLELAKGEPKRLNLDKAELLAWSHGELHTLYRAIVGGNPVPADE